MALYTFEVDPQSPAHRLELTARMPNAIQKRILKDRGSVSYRQVLTGLLSIQDMSTDEAEAVKRSLALDARHSSKHVVSHVPLCYLKEETEYLNSFIDSGRLAVQAIMHRAETISLGKHGNVLTSLQLAPPKIRSLAGNLAALRHKYVEAFMDCPPHAQLDAKMLAGMVTLSSVATHMEAEIAVLVSSKFEAANILNEESIRTAALNSGLECPPFEPVYPTSSYMLDK